MFKTKFWRNQDKGKYGEYLARGFLRRKGFKFIAERYRIQGGEVDIIATRGKTIGFFEVKYRSSPIFGDPLTAITEKKLKAMYQASQHFLRRYPQFSNKSPVYYALAVRPYQKSLPIEMVPIFLD